MVAPLVWAALATALGAGASALGGKGASFEDAIGAVQGNPAFDPKISAFPRGGFNAGGGSYQQGQDKYVDFTKMPKFLEGLRNGTKGKNLPPETKAKILANPNKVLLSELQLTNFVRDKANAKGAIGKPFPTFDAQSNPNSSALFEQGQQINLNNAKAQEKINKMITSMIMPNQINFLNNSIKSANKMSPQMFEVDPTVQASINKKSDDFFTLGSKRIGDSYRDITDGQDMNLITDGAYFSSDLQDLRGTADKKLADSLGELNLSTEAMRRDDIDRALANNRAGVNTLYGAGQFDAGINQLNLPEDKINPLFFQPYGEYGQGDTMFNQFNQAQNYGLQREQIRQAPLINAIAPGFQVASQPGPMQSFGSMIGSLAPYLMFMQGKGAKK